jgi:hypothetical protein
MANLEIKLFDKLYVGFQKRNTESGSPLGFLTPWGEDAASKGRMATVDKWASSSKLKSIVIDNVPVTGFRISDHARRGGWRGGSTVIQIEDPRGFELQITVDNMIQIMNNNICVNGEIQIPCVWGRDGKENILLPINSEPYENAMENTERLKQTVSMRSVKIGNKIEMKDGRVGIYYGAYYQIMRDIDTKTSYVPFSSTRSMLSTTIQKMKLSKDKLHAVYVLENKARDDFKPRIEMMKSIKVARMLDDSTITNVEAECQINDEFLISADYRTCIGYVSTDKFEFKIEIEPVTANDLIERQGLHSWSTGRVHFIAKTPDNEYLHCDGCTLVETSKSQRHIPNIGYVKDDRVYGIVVNFDEVKNGTVMFSKIHQYSYNTAVLDEYIKAYRVDELEFFQPYVVYTSEKTGVQYKLPY